MASFGLKWQLVHHVSWLAGAAVLATGCGGTNSSPVACVAAPTTNQCTDPAAPVDCGGGKCAPQAARFGCPVGAFETEVEAKVECGDACQACNTTPPATCVAAPTTNQCTDPAAPVDCGDPNGGCYPSGAQFACVAKGQGFPTQASAQTSCGNACHACNTTPPQQACAAAPTTNACTNPANPVDCGGPNAQGVERCAPQGARFGCPDAAFATEAAARASCGSACQACNTTPPPACSVPTAANNSALLTGASLGTGAIANASLTKRVPVALTGTGYAARDAYVFRSSTTSTYVWFVVPLVNTGSSLACFVKVSTGSAGSYSLANQYITGSVGYSGTVRSDTCLSPCEVGYLTGITNTTTYDEVNSVTLALSADTGVTLSTGRVIPQSYTSDSVTGLSVSVRNAGGFAVNLATYLHQYILLDANNQIVDYGYFDTNTLSSVAADTSAVMTAKGVASFAGSASKLIAEVNFVSADGRGALTGAPAPADQARLDEVNAQRKREQAMLWQAAARP